MILLVVFPYYAAKLQRKSELAKKITNNFVFLTPRRHPSFFSGIRYF